MSEVLTHTMKSEVVERAFGICEYCRVPDSSVFHDHEADHILPRKHGGETVFENMAFSCWRCNRHKGSDVGSFDFEADGVLVRFFNPRIDVWAEHFRLVNALVKPLSPEARVTIKILRINDEERIEERTVLIENGIYD